MPAFWFCITVNDIICKNIILRIHQHTIPVICNITIMPFTQVKVIVVNIHFSVRNCWISSKCHNCSAVMTIFSISIILADIISDMSCIISSQCTFKICAWWIIMCIIILNIIQFWIYICIECLWIFFTFWCTWIEYFIVLCYRIFCSNKPQSCKIGASHCHRRLTVTHVFCFCTSLCSNVSTAILHSTSGRPCDVMILWITCCIVRISCIW